jgi:hypothetical protein
LHETTQEVFFSRQQKKKKEGENDLTRSLAKLSPTKTLLGRGSGVFLRGEKTETAI